MSKSKQTKVPKQLTLIKIQKVSFFVENYQIVSLKKEVEKIMSSGRKTDRKNLTWTVTMLNDLKSCKQEVVRRKAIDDAST